MKTSTITQSLAVLFSMAITAPIVSAFTDQLSRRSDCHGMGKPTDFEEGAVRLTTAKDEQNYEKHWVPIGGRHKFDFGQYLNVDCSVGCFSVGENEIAVCDIFHDGNIMGTCVSNKRDGLTTVWNGFDNKIKTNEIECRKETVAPPAEISTLRTLAVRSATAV